MITATTPASTKKEASMRRLIALCLLFAVAIPASGNVPPDIQESARSNAVVYAFHRLADLGYISPATRAVGDGFFGKQLVHATSSPAISARTQEIERAFDALYPARGAPPMIAIDAGPLRNIPRPDRVLAEIPPSPQYAIFMDPARKMAALLIMRDAIRWASGKPLVNMMPDEPRALAMSIAYFVFEFDTEGNALRAYNTDGCIGYTCNRTRYFDTKTNLELGDNYRREILARYFSQDIAAAYIKYINHKPPPLPGTEVPRPQLGSKTIVNYIVGTLFFIIPGIFVIWLLRRIFRPRPKPKPVPDPVSDIYGKAAFNPLVTGFPHHKTFQNGVFLGKISSPEFNDPPPLERSYAPVFSTPESHTLIVAKIRTGKGTRIIVPTLLTYADSLLTIDPKGEIAAITARARRDRLGQTVHIVNPWDELAQHFTQRGFASSACYNPLDILDRNDPNAVAIANSLSRAICPEVAGDADPIWQGSAATIIAAVLLWLADHPQETKTLARARQLLSRSREELRNSCLSPMYVSSAYDGAMSEMIGTFIDLPEKTYGSVMHQVSTSMTFISDPRVKASTSKSSFSMQDLVVTNTTVYLIIPPAQMDTQQAWLRLMLTAATQTFKRCSTDPRRNKRRCMILIDEFARVGTLKDMPGDVATLSGYGVDFTLVIQNLSQLQQHYGKDGETIINNCAWKWFCNISGTDAAYVSNLLGQKTVRTFGETRGSSASPGGASSSHSFSKGETGRPLMRPEEITSLGRKFAICIGPMPKPLFLQTIDYWNLEAAFAHLQADYPGLYWQPPLEYDANPYVSDSSEKRGQQSNEQKQDRGSRADSEQPNRKTGLTKEQAREILEVGPNATPDEIKAAYKRLMAKVHPDKGGSTYFAKQLNAARETLLEE